MFLDTLFSDPQRFVTVVLVVMLSIVLHELGHALAATWEGDPTPRVRGHLTWNPVVHMGWLAIGLLVVMGISFGSTPVTPAYFRHRRWGEVLVSFAGPAVNLCLAVAFAACHAFTLSLDPQPGTPEDLVLGFWQVGTVLNVALFFFNMIPLPPFDGFTVLEGFVDLGELGPLLRRAQPFPMLAAFLFVAMGPWFWELVHVVAGVLLPRP